MAFEMSASDNAWNAYMNSPASRQTFEQLSAPGPGSLWANMPSASQYKKTTDPKPQSLANWGKIVGNPVGSSFSLGQASAQSAMSTPVEFYLGSAPTMQGVDLSGVMGNFRDTFNQLNSGVNPNFFVDQNQLVADAKSAAQKLNLTPGEIKQMIAGINPSIQEVTAQAASAAAQLNNPKKIGEQANKMADILNKKYIDQFDAAMPGYKQNMQKTNEITSNYLAGKIPQDVVDQIFRSSAAKGFTTGLYGGGIGRNVVARDLGLTSLQLQSAGAGLLDQTAKLAATVGREMMPVSGAEFVNQLITNPGTIFSTIANYNHVDPSAIFNAVYVKSSDVYNNMSNMAQQSTMARANFEASKMVPPSQVFGALTDQAQYNSQISNANALNAWQSQALPGQFDIQKGQYVSFTPGQYLAQRPTPPGFQEQLSASMGGAISKPSLPENFSRMRPSQQGLAFDQFSQQTALYNQQQQEMAKASANWTGSAYVPQLRA
jgi:hypothetical protein